jgi:hypothetical protein
MRSILAHLLAIALCAAVVYMAIFIAKNQAQAGEVTYMQCEIHHNQQTHVMPCRIVSEYLAVVQL